MHISDVSPRARTCVYVRLVACVPVTVDYTRILDKMHWSRVVVSTAWKILAAASIKALQAFLGGNTSTRWSIKLLSKVIRDVVARERRRDDKLHASSPSLIIRDYYDVFTSTADQPREEDAF